MSRQKRFPRFSLILPLIVLVIAVGLVVAAFLMGEETRHDSEIKSALVNIRKEAEILADGNSYVTVCADDENAGFGLPVGIPERNKIGQLVNIIIDNSPDPKVDRPICSVSLQGDSLAIFSRTSKGLWCVDTRGNEGFGQADKFVGVCQLIK